MSPLTKKEKEAVDNAIMRSKGAERVDLPTDLFQTFLDAIKCLELDYAYEKECHRRYKEMYEATQEELEYQVDKVREAAKTLRKDFL